MIWLSILRFPTLRRREELLEITRFSKLWQFPSTYPALSLQTILGWRSMLSVARRGFTPPVTRDRTRVTTKKLRSYWSSLGELALRRTQVALDSVACWRWRAKARFSECLKGLLRDKSLIDRAGHTDSDMIRFLFLTASNELLVSLNLRKKTN